MVYLALIPRGIPQQSDEEAEIEGGVSFRAQVGDHRMPRGERDALVSSLWQNPSIYPNVTNDVAEAGGPPAPTVAHTLRPGSEPAVAGVDRALLPLIHVAIAALNSQRLVVLLNLWRPLAGIPLFPFHLSIRWPNECDALPLDAAFSFYPHSTLDAAWLELPIYDPADALAARQAARVMRVQTNPGSRLARADWEQAAAVLRRTRWRSLLAGNCFACVQRIQTDGTLNSQSRPVFGRRSARGAYKPCVRVLSPSRISPQSLKTFVTTDLVVIDAQNQRGFRASERLREVIQASSETAAVLIASSPSDLYRVRQQLPKDVRLITSGMPPELNSVSVVQLPDDRAIAEKEFSFAIEGLDSNAPLTIASKCAWWALRQSMGSDYDFELQRFDDLYSELTSRDPVAGMRYAGVNLMLHRDAGLAPMERQAQAVTTVFASSSRVGTLVVTRNAQAREALANALAVELSVTVEQLAELNVFVVTKNASDLPPVDAAIVTGFFGADTFDLALTARVRSVVLIVDEVEARGALWMSIALSEICKPQGIVIPALDRLRDGIRPFVTGEGDEFGLDLLPALLTSPEAQTGGVGSGTNPNFVTLSFTDGSARRVPRNTRFDLFKGRLRITTARAHDLRPGDTIVLLDYESHAALSDQLLSRLDQGVLRQHAVKRKAWLNLVGAGFRASGKSIAQVARTMALAGHAVDVATVRTWLIPSGEQDIAVPISFNKTLALARAIGLEFPDSTVNDFYSSIAVVRRRHRHAGRLLARAIRGIQVRRLDIVTLRKLEAEWGFDPSDLLKGANVVEVDEVYGA